MTQAEFLIAFQDMLQRDDAVEMGYVLKDMEEWDSLAFMAIISFYDLHFGIRLTFENLLPCVSVADIVALSEGNIA